MHIRALIFASIFFQYALCYHIDSHNFNQKHLFKQEIISTATFTNETRIICYVKQNLVGSISYTKIPLLPYYIIHSLFVYRQRRKQGHGEALLMHACDTIEHNGGTKIYIQPGPFEIQNNTMVAINDPVIFEQQLQNLLKFYQKRGFEYVSTCTALSAYVLYKLMRINENAQYLMVKVIQ
jgi:GNAT superfamily N-acetyltransferase